MFNISKIINWSTFYNEKTMKLLSFYLLLLMISKKFLSDKPPQNEILMHFFFIDILNNLLRFVFE